MNFFYHFLDMNKSKKNETKFVLNYFTTLFQFDFALLNSG